ncbi:MAG: hydrogenase maturation protease [Bacteroidales bacterium]|nr:hydrogenase maturation protease [Bacteroidales bacterium]
MRDNLSELIRDNDRTILFVGIGNLLRQDDGAGVYISTRIMETENIKVITAEASIENYIGKINSIEHDLLVLMDCADMNSPPGTWDIIPPEHVSDLTFNTHNISLKKLSGFFKKEVLVLAIQPETVAFGENLSYIVLEACGQIIELINKKEVQNGR